MDKRVFEILDKEIDRQTSTIELIESEISSIRLLPNF